MSATVEQRAKFADIVFLIVSLAGENVGKGWYDIQPQTMFGGVVPPTNTVKI